MIMGLYANASSDGIFDTQDLTAAFLQGILRLNHITDEILKDAAQEVIMVRPGYFQEDFVSALEQARADPPVVHAWSSPADHKIPMVREQRHDIPVHRVSFETKAGG